MSENSEVLLQRFGNVWQVTINRPQSRNALTLSLRKSLADVFELASTSAHCKALVLQGYGEHFCAGGDIKSMSSDVAVNQERMAELKRLALNIAGCPKPVIVAVEGSAFGAGFSLALLGDIVIAAEDARFCASFSRIGLGPDGGITLTLPAAVGRSRATTMLLSAREMSSKEGMSLGFVDEMVRPGDAGSVALERARQLVRRSGEALAATKAMLGPTSGALTKALDMEASCQTRLMQTPEFMEAVRWFTERRGTDD